MKNKGKYPVIMVGLALLLLFTMIGAILLGTVDITVKECLKIIGGHIPGVSRLVDLSEVKPSHITIIMDLRLPRILLAALAGMGLAAAGCTYQGVFSNPMADPYLIGVSSGAAFGATLALLFNWHFTLLRTSMVSVAAFIGAVSVMSVAFLISRVRGKLPTITLILSGIAINYFLSSVIALLMLFNREKIESVYFWTLGSFQNAKWEEVGLVAIVTLIGICIIYRFFMELNILMLQGESSKTVGVNGDLIKKVLLLGASLMVAVIVSVCGVIGFVGLLIPHTARILIGPHHKRLIPFATLFGGIFMVAADTLARSLLKNAEISVGIITAVFGVPFFLILLYQNKKTLA